MRLGCPGMIFSWAPLVCWGATALVCLMITVAPWDFNGNGLRNCLVAHFNISSNHGIIETVHLQHQWNSSAVFRDAATASRVNTLDDQSSTTSPTITFCSCSYDYKKRHYLRRQIQDIVDICEFGVRRILRFRPLRSDPRQRPT